MFGCLGSWETSHSFGLTPSSLKMLIVLPVLVGIWNSLPPKRLMFWRSSTQHMRWLAYEVPAWFTDPIHWRVHSCTSYTEMGPIWESRSLRHDFGGYISTQTLLLWVPMFPRHQEASNFLLQWRTAFPQPSDCGLKPLNKVCLPFISLFIPGILSSDVKAE